MDSSACQLLGFLLVKCFQEFPALRLPSGGSPSYLPVGGIPAAAQGVFLPRGLLPSPPTMQEPEIPV